MKQYKCNDKAKASSKSSCLDSCLNGYKPSRRYTCYVKPDESTGNCPANSFFSNKQQDYSVDLPYGVSRPTFCTWSARYGPGSIAEKYGLPWEADTEAKREAWTYRVGEETYKLYTYEGRRKWNEFTGYHNVDLFFASDVNAKQACDAFNASYMLVDDGSSSCSYDFCYAPDKSTKESCHSFYSTVASKDGLRSTYFRSSYNNSNGICSIEFEHPSNYHSLSNSNARKEACQQVNGTFVRGMEFRAGKMDT